MKIVATVFSALLLSASPLAAAPVEGPAPVDVMVLGSYHFANPGKDVVNIVADDVTKPHRQAELRALIAAVAEFRPDRVLIERQVHADNFVVQSFEKFKPADLAEQHNENVQIGYRLAHRLGHAHVYGFDERPSDGEPDYFPLGAVRSFAEEHDRVAELGQLFAMVEDKAKAFEAKQACQSIPSLLLEENEPEEIGYWHRLLYYGMLEFGTRDNQAGAELNAYWYMRNAKMMAKIGLIARPGEKVFVLVGAGHKYWLEHFLANTPGYRSIDPRPYLQKAASRLPSQASCQDD